MAMYEKKKEKLAAKITTLKARIKKDTDELNKAQAEYSELCFTEIKAKENCDEQQLADTLVQEHNLIQLLRDKGFTDEQIVALANGADSSAVSKPVSKKDNGSKVCDTSEDSTEDDDEIKFYGDALTD